MYTYAHLSEKTLNDEYFRRGGNYSIHILLKLLLFKFLTRSFELVRLVNCTKFLELLKIRVLKN